MASPILSNIPTRIHQSLENMEYHLGFFSLYLQKFFHFPKLGCKLHKVEGFLGEILLDFSFTCIRASTSSTYGERSMPMCCVHVPSLLSAQSEPRAI